MEYVYQSSEYDSEPEYESEYEFEQVTPVVKKLSPLQMIAEERKRKEREKLAVQKKNEQEETDRREAAVVKTHLRWINAPVQRQETMSLDQIEKEQIEEREWTQVKREVRVAQVADTSNHKSEMCKSLATGSKFKCKKGNACVYAHNTKELRPLDCPYGSSCRFTRLDYRKGAYVNTDKGKRVCTRKHPNESKTNFFCRTGIKDPVTVEEMDSDWNFINDFYIAFNNDHGEIVNNLKKRIENTPCNRNVEYILDNPVTGNIMACKFSGKLPAVEEKKQKVYKYKPMVNYLDQKKQKDEKANIIEKINKVTKELAVLAKSVKTNEGVITRFSERTDSEACMQKVVSLKLENQQIQNKIKNLEIKLVELKEPKKEVPRVMVENCWTRKAAPVVVEPKAERSIFDLSVKSFRLAVSKEITTSQPRIESVPVPVPETISKTKTELCRSVGKYECKHHECRFAHNKDELKVVRCPFGDRCFDVECIAGVYRNKVNAKNRICQKQHSTETIQSVYTRLGLKDVPKPDPIVKDEGGGGDWTLVKTRRPAPAPKIESNERTQLCKSVPGKYVCRSDKDCKFAHNKKELKILRCSFGEKCFDVENAGRGVYRNKKNIKNRVCQRQHEGESLISVYQRVGLN